MGEASFFFHLCVWKSLLLEGGVQLVVERAKLIPCRTVDDRLVAGALSSGSFTEDHGKTDFQMPVNVTVQEPRAWVVREEAESGVSTLHGDDVSSRGVHEVGDVGVGRPDDVEGMPVKMDGVSTRSGDRNFDDRVLGQQDHVLVGQEVVGGRSTAENLEQGRECWGLKGDAVDLKERRVRLSDDHLEGNIGGYISTG